MGRSGRLDAVLSFALIGIDHEVIAVDKGIPDLSEKRVIFSEACGEWGVEYDYIGLLLHLRKNRESMRGSIGGMIINGESEMYTKELARKLIFSANMSGCFFPGKPLVEATGSLLNYNIRSRNLNTDNLTAYKLAARALAEKVAKAEPQKHERPRILVVHSSERATSNTLAIGTAVTELLRPSCDITEIPMTNAPVHDCRGCGYRACSHYGKQHDCYYGGIVVDEIYPALLESDALMLLCPNYNDTPSAKLVALINRLTALAAANSLENKYLFAIVVSGYSGSDLVAQQLLGSLCLNKTFMLAPGFCMMETAHEPGSVMKFPGIETRIRSFAENILTNLCAGR
jgi:multimeric flavodoxin WrbA